MEYRTFFFTIVIIFVISFAAHLAFLSRVPRGLYMDEASIGVNAATIVDQGVDEHGVSYPVFFEAFGEYKNGLYIYATSVVFMLFGISEFTLRLTSFLFFALFQAGFVLLVQALLKDRRVTIYAALSSGFLPFFFAVSRVSFELISHLTVTVFSLLFLFLALQAKDDSRKAYLFAFFAGLCTSLTVYAYSTARLLTPIFFLLVALLYVRRKKLKTMIMYFVSSFFFLVPFLIFYFGHPGALTGRFGEISYIGNTSLTLIHKIGYFIAYYFSYFSPDFLLFHGDPNLRHHVGGGMMYAIVVVLFIVSIVAFFVQKKYRQKFWLLLMLFLLASPVAAALTETGHSLRTMIFGILFLLFSCFGLLVLLEGWKKNVKVNIFVVVMVILVLESSFFVGKYFIAYPDVSDSVFGSYGYQEVLQETLERSPREIIVSFTDTPDYRAELLPSFVDFYRYVVPNPENIPIHVAPAVGVPGSCVLFRSNQYVEHMSGTAFEEISIKDGVVKAQCFANE